ncbi:exodeoxyribonuclease VII small subunit [Halosegnis marinus]|uniref:Uncharacterized protein n=1 Tax=Halosegnis marinus TaxID=3034023 RepID=A0ABD5ZSM8_9EURY|nr:exodeoxyribonuclease VII small subunit [Halosegnis sp. DT85]
MTQNDDIRQKIDRVEEIRNELQQADTMNPADAKALRDEAMQLLEELESDLAVGDGEITRHD